MGFKQFSLSVIIRTVLAMLSLALLTVLLTADGYHATSLVMSVILMIQLGELIRYVTRTNAELVRFFEAARHADYSQKFNNNQLGAGFDELGEVFSDILDKLQQARLKQEEGFRHVKAVVEHVPVPLLSISANDEITLWNNNARKLFGTNPVVRLEDLTRFNPDFPELIKHIKPGGKSLVTVEVDGMPQQLSVAVTEVIVAQQKERLVSLQDIQSELDAAQLQAWQDLVSVLTHEIMNSITPVASLAKTAVDIVDDLSEEVSDTEIKEELQTVSQAVNTVSKRSDSLMSFVASYRQLTRLPPPNKTIVNIEEWITELTQLTCADWPQRGIELIVNVEPESLTAEFDQDMLSQCMINLLKNAEQAVAETKLPSVIVTARLNKRGNPVINIEDNGCGMSEDIIKNAFVPFYTTKREGSGVGLALTRQVMLAHKGHIGLQSEVGKGSLFTLSF